ncbi:alpha-mannosidase [Neobacillus mesonae]|nr:alpha-mannosidase [Neobacillus mesonae]
MSKQLKAHIISHTHWDREWYLPYEKHHMRLISLMDALLDKLDHDPEYKSFYLDGQTIILEDYLQVRPEQQKRIEKHIRDGRILIGPWYILQDAFLTSGEANVRNMQEGHQDSKRYGAPSKIGYFPDTFGLVGQTPQLMKQSGINNVFFGRGVKPTGFNNMVSESDFESSYSELEWESPDGSKVLGILFANWYSNGNEIPVNEEEAKVFWDRKLADAAKYASTKELLFMNGCDHQPLQLDLPEAIDTAQRLYPNVEFIHSNFPDYLVSLQNMQGSRLSTVKGELRSQRTDGWGTLVNTASARVYLKQMNQLGQVMLEKVAEPLASLANMLGEEYPHHKLRYAWRTLMQNHPHDSICGCSVDEVHKEMVVRFDKSRHVAEAVIDDSKSFVANYVDTSSFTDLGEDPKPVVVFNTSGWERSGVISIEIDFARLYFREGLPLSETAERMKDTDISGRILIDAEGNQADCTIEDLGLQFGYDLPDNKFRQPYMSRRVRLTFEAEHVPALGLKTYAWVKGRQKPEGSMSLLSSGRVLENESLKIEVMDNGSYTMVDKQTGRRYEDLGIYEDVGDIGNEYMFKQPEGEMTRTTSDLKAVIRVLEDTSYRASIEITHEWEVPASAENTLDLEQRELIYYPNRTSGRTEQMIPLTIRTVLTLERNGKTVKIETNFNNQAKDHRLRILFPTDIASSVHHADSLFEIAARDNHPAAEWENPSNTQHQQSFVSLSEENEGLTIANLGLNEYEILRDGRNTIAVTLLRSVGELGDWGYFPTPGAQCLGEHTVHLSLIPHNGDGVKSGAYKEAYQFQTPWTAVQTDMHTGIVAPTHAFLQWDSPNLAFSSMKVNEESNDLMLRWYNMSRNEAVLKLRSNDYSSCYKSNILEDTGEQMAMENSGEINMPVAACEIMTLGLIK